MNYSKKLMSVSELAKECGFSKEDLYAAAHNEHYAHHYITTTKGGRKYLFDTEKFEKYRQLVMRSMIAEAERIKNFERRR